MTELNPMIISTALKPEKIMHSDGNQYYVYNVSLGYENYSQLRSPYKFSRGEFSTNKYSLCNVHMMGMALEYIGYDKILKKRFDEMYPEYTRLPDKLAAFILESDEMNTFYKKQFPSFYKEFENGEKNAVAPNEVHAVLNYGVNKFCDYGTVTYFSTHTHWFDIIGDLIYDNLPVGISGKFAGLNHIVLLVGAAFKTLDSGDRPGENQMPDFLIVDDPYGKTYEYDKGLSGNDVWIPFEKCVKDFKSLDNPNFKFAHRFIRPKYLGF